MTVMQRDDPAIDLACETLYRFVGVGLRDPHLEGMELIFDSASQRLAAEAAELLREEFGDQPIPLGFGELPLEDLDLQSTPGDLKHSLDGLRDEYDRVFGLSNCRECPPYETEYHKAEDVFFRSQQMADVAGFYQAFGLAPGGACRERPDHLAMELEFAAYLLMMKRVALAASQDPLAQQHAATCQEARLNFFRDHMSWWMPSFSLALRRKAEHGFYAGLGRTLSALLPVERHRLEIAPPRMPLEASLIESPDECSGCLVQLKG